jgi:hypothetical protein
MQTFSPPVLFQMISIVVRCQLPASKSPGGSRQKPIFRETWDIGKQFNPFLQASLVEIRGRFCKQTLEQKRFSFKTSCPVLIWKQLIFIIASAEVVMSSSSKDLLSCDWTDYYIPRDILPSSKIALILISSLHEVV